MLSAAENPAGITRELLQTWLVGAWRGDGGYLEDDKILIKWQFSANFKLQTGGMGLY
jgi:hypothetical protein